MGKKKPAKQEFRFDLTTPLDVRFSLSRFDETLEALGKALGYKMECGGGGCAIGSGKYDYSMHMKCESSEQAETAAKELRKAAWQWLKDKWSKKLMLREVELSEVSPT